MIQLSEEGMSKAQTGNNLGLPLTPNSQVVNAKEKFLKKIKSATPGNTLIRKWKSFCWYGESFGGLDRWNQPHSFKP